MYSATGSTIQIDGDEIDATVTDVDLEVSNSLDHETVSNVGTQEIEFSVDIPLQDQTVCPECGEPNAIDAALQTFFEWDTNCVECGFPLGVVR